MRLVQKLLDILLSMRGLLIHLLMLSNVLMSSLFSSFSNFFKYDFRCLIGMGGHHLYTTSMEWSEHSRVDDMAYRLQVLFYFLFLRVCQLLRCL